MTDAVVVGTGPNGLAAAVTLARAGLTVRVFEGAPTAGGGTRTAELTLPGFHHDVCSAVHPMALTSPFFEAFELEKRINLIVPSISYAHALDATTAGIAYRSLNRTAERLGRDGEAYRRIFDPLVHRIDGINDFTQHQMLRIPRDPLAAILYGLRALEQGGPWWNLRFAEETAPAMITGVSAHSIGALPGLATSGTGLLLGAQAHSRGWPVPEGGSQAIAQAMVEDLMNHGGEIVCDVPVSNLAQLRDGPAPKAILLDLSAAGLAEVAAAELPTNYLRKLASFRYGNAVSKAIEVPSEQQSERLQNVLALILIQWTIHQNNLPLPPRCSGNATGGRGPGASTPGPPVTRKTPQPGRVTSSGRPSTTRTNRGSARFIPKRPTLDRTAQDYCRRLRMALLVNWLLHKIVGLGQPGSGERL